MKVVFAGFAAALVCGLWACSSPISTGPAQGSAIGGACASCKKGSSGGNGVGATGGSGGSHGSSSSGGVAGGSTGQPATGSSGSSGANGPSTSTAGGSSGGVAGGASSGGGSSGGSTGACLPPQAVGGPCASAMDCEAGLVCTGEVCPQPTSCTPGSCVEPGPTPSLACLRDGAACTASEACCGGSCVNGSCLARIACGLDNSPCTVNSDCCDYYSCQTGLCEPSCGQLYSSCQVDGDCCSDQGLICALFVQLSVSACVPGAEDQVTTGSGSNIETVLCGGPCSTYECQLGAACELDANGDDPCAAAGLVCDLSNEVCRDPQLFESCLQGGPPCEPSPESTAASQCIALPGQPTPLCLQPCAQTSDCVDALTSCFDDPGAGGSFCNADACTTAFATCAAEGTQDGLCEPEGSYQGVPQLFCAQLSADGGSAGQGCSVFDNRQEGDFCAFPNICNGGLCLPACNAGTSGVPGCGAPGATCFGVQGLEADADDLGLCSVPCDFTSPDGGGCAQVAGGPEQKCLPQLVLGLPDAPIGFCVAELPSPIAVGQACDSVQSGLDDCVAGALCLEPAVGENARCLQLCNLVSSSPGTGGCASNDVCTALSVGGDVQPTSSGFCQPPG